MKRFFLTLFLAVICALGFCKGKSDNETAEVLASTSWTAAFADIAGVDNVDYVAPASLRHPPEYEITVGDIQKVAECKIFIFAGFERMMKTLGDSTGQAQMVKIVCDNSIETVSRESRKIAAITGTQAACEARLAEYIKVIEDGKKNLQKTGNEGAKVLCNKNQTYLAKELGLEIVAVFGPGPVTSDQILDAKNQQVDYIIDNIHNPVGQPLAEVVPSAKYIVWRNFPEKFERGALAKVVQANIQLLKK